MSIHKTIDTKLVVQPVIGIMCHEYVFEGPCRFGAGEELTYEFDKMTGAEGFKAFRENLAKYIAPEPDFEMLEPVSAEILETFEVTDEMMDHIMQNDAKVDVYLFTAIGRTYPIVLELATRSKKPLICLQEACDKTQVPAMLRSRGLECVSEMTWEETVKKMKAYYLKKVLQKSKMLLLTRAYKDSALVSACDGFINLDEASQKLGFRYQLMDVHEFIDQTHEEGGTAPTMPTRRPNFLTKEEMQEIGQLADKMIAGAGYCNVSRDDVINALRFYKTAKKMMDHYECNCFSAPCPEMCATTRLNQERITPCFTHSLLNAEGISSACEYDIPGLVMQILLSAANKSGAYLGNCLPMYFEKDGKTVMTAVHPQNDIQEKVNALTQEERDHLCFTYHSSVNIQMKGFDAEPMKYDIRNYTGTGWGPTIRHDFALEKGQVLTMGRISPDCKTMFLGKAHVVGAVGDKMSGCTQGILFTVDDVYDWYHKQCNVGNHVPMVMGDVMDEMIDLGHLLGLNVVTA